MKWIAGPHSKRELKHKHLYGFILWICLTPQAAAKTQEPSGPVPDTPASEKTPYALSATEDMEDESLIDTDFRGKISLDELASVIARKLKRNIIIDPALKNKHIEIIAPSQLQTDELWSLFLSALKLHGMSTVESGRLTKIIKQQSGLQEHSPVSTSDSDLSGDSDQLITQVVSLNYVDPEEIRKTLSGFTTSGSIVSLKETGHLIISDSAAQVRRLLDIISLMDVRTRHSRLELFPLRYAQASVMSENLKQLISARKSSALSKNKAQLSSWDVSLITDKERNLIAVFASDAIIQEIGSYIRTLDIAPSDHGDQSNIYFRPLEYADADKLLATLKALAGPGAGDMEELRLAADPDSNSLIIVGSSQARASVEQVIRKFDIRRDQVLIEVEIIAINTNHEFRSESSILTGQNISSQEGGARIITGWQAATAAPLAYQAQSADQKAKAAESLMGTLGEALTVGILSEAGIAVPGLGLLSPAALLRFIRTDQDSKVLSSPHLLSANHEEASLSVGQRLFFRARNSSSGTPSAAANVLKEDVSLTLRVKPSLAGSQYISLTLNLEANQVTGFSSEGYPAIGKRKFNHTLTLKDRQTAVVAGMTELVETTSISEVPLLGKIPILGPVLFSQRSKGYREQQLIIFLKAERVKNDQDLRTIYERKLQENVAFLQIAKRTEINGSRFPSESTGKSETSDKKSLDLWEDKTKLNLRQESP
ncbi:MAG: hypothetical protein H6618_00765 [Deltaproteobacteria bacterium]|nr:hypothetical protein [Deltaproteobacteria bacterium]